MAITLDGTTGITAPGVTDTGNLSVAGTSTLTGSIGNVTAGTVTASTGVLYPIVNGTAQASTSGTSITFSSIPSWVKRITLMLSGVSTSGTSSLLLQLGSGSVTTSGYISGSNISTSVTSSTSGFVVNQANSGTFTQYGIATVSLVSGNTWVYSAITIPNTVNSGSYAAGGVTLSGTLDRIVVTTINGTDTFDAGSINIQYE